MKYSGIRSILAIACMLAVVMVVPIVAPLALVGALLVPGLKIMRQTSDQFMINLAAYHSPHITTWSWCLSFIRPRSADEGRWLSCHFHSGAFGWQTGLQIARHELLFMRQTYHLRRHSPLMC